MNNTLNHLNIRDMSSMGMSGMNMMTNDLKIDDKQVVEEDRRDRWNNGEDDRRRGDRDRDRNDGRYRSKKKYEPYSGKYR